MSAEFSANEFITIPMPNENLWIRELQIGPDTKKVILSLSSSYASVRDTFEDLRWYEALTEDRLHLDGVMLYHFEEKNFKRCMQLRTIIVPKALRKLVFSACNASPIAGHTGVYKTHWRTVSRFWWPGISSDVRKWTL